jgi:hypothetical protein
MRIIIVCFCMIKRMPYKFSGHGEKINGRPDKAQPPSGAKAIPYPRILPAGAALARAHKCVVLFGLSFVERRSPVRHPDGMAEILAGSLCTKGIVQASALISALAFQS